MANKRVNIGKTVQNILDKINKSIGYSIDIEKFNQRKNDKAFIIEAANFLGVEVVFEK
jgi:hypothetical protein